MLYNLFRLFSYTPKVANAPISKAISSTIMNSPIKVFIDAVEETTDEFVEQYTEKYIDSLEEDIFGKEK